MQAITQTIDIGQGKQIVLETGKLAKQAHGAVVVSQGDTMVLCTAVIDSGVREGQSFFPLTVDYREKYSAAGKFPGGFMKREGRPTDKETLSSRLVDRTIRPLFPDGFRNEVQVLLSVMSADQQIDADVLGGLGGSAALYLTGAPFDGPTAHVRVGRVDGEFIINPTVAEAAEGDFDLIVAGKEDAIVMVEGEMKEVSEDDMIAALDFAHEVIKKLCRAQVELRQKVEAAKGTIEPMQYDLKVADDSLVEKVRKIASDRIAAHLRQPYDKKSLYGGLSDMKKEVVAEVQGGVVENALEAVGAKTEPSEGDIKDAFSSVQSEVMREMILSEGVRIDGRKLDEVRQIWSEIDYLPRVHGSALFTRGETQVLAQMTLGTGRDVQGVDQLFNQTDKRFYLHYNFPPFSVGEARFLRGPGRREIGHGMLAERALSPMLPSADEFPYTIRIIADVLESNGSSSMASVCSGSMAMMAGGVPLKKPVAGIAMGLIKTDDRVAILSDILGTEDHLGDMDFKLTGTRDGITACQMDIKVSGLAKETMKQALDQARAGRQHILDEMAKTIAEPREEVAATAPRLFQLVIDSEFIGAIIGPGGKNIKALQAETNTQVNVDEEDGKGYVTISATNQEDAEAAIEIIRGIVTVPEVGEEYEGTVRKMLPFGAILEILPGKEGMLHVSEMAHGYVENPEDEMQVGDKVKVQLIEVRDDGKLRFSRKPYLPEPTEEEKEASRQRRSSSNGDGGSRGGDRGGRSGGGRGGNRGGGRNR
ncbi:MAG: polyribonucleotide nucleotidyltransferase [Rhodothermales bacterium]